MVKEQENLGGFEGLLRLKAGNRYTLVTMSAFGIGVCAMKFTFHRAGVGPYAQYPEAVELRFLLKGKRTPGGMRFYGRMSFALYDGWIDVDTNAYQSVSTDGPFSVS